MILQTKRLLLREIRIEDTTHIHLLNSLEETNQFNTSGAPESILQTEELVALWVKEATISTRKKYVFFIQEDANNFIGLIGLTMGKPGYNNAEIWYKLHPDFWNKGFATESVKWLLDFGFNNLKLHRIEAGCAIENQASIKVLEKCGFKREGHTRKLLPIHGQWHDNYGYALLEEDYFE
jgi:[ribosomal protein S5]-alanine N-acetyltransferase